MDSAKGLTSLNIRLRPLYPKPASGKPKKEKRSLPESKEHQYALRGRAGSPHQRRRAVARKKVR